MKLFAKSCLLISCFLISYFISSSNNVTETKKSTKKITSFTKEEIRQLRKSLKKVSEIKKVSTVLVKSKKIDIKELNRSFKTNKETKKEITDALITYLNKQLEISDESLEVVKSFIKHDKDVDYIREKLHSQLIDNTPKTKPQRDEITSLEEQNRFHQISNEQRLYVEGFKTLYRLTDSDNKYELTLDLLKRVDDRFVAREIASVHLDSNPTDIDRLVDEYGIERANFIAPPNFELEQDENLELVINELEEPSPKLAKE